jgi:meso-butanediol dehydrogenase/(S,S)-butanediol dehydrogenase/diacetyl reductase
MHDFGGKVAFVTGAGAGIGRAVARLWAQRGGDVVVTDRNEADAQAVAAEIVADGGRAYPFRLDVSNLDDIRATVDAAAVRAGAIDALFNVAGTNLPKRVDEISDDEWLMQMDTNLSSVYRCSKYVIPALRQRGGGAIVNVASVAGIMGEGRCSGYSASKAGVVNLTRNMALDFARENIRVNAICPGGTWTPRIEQYMERTGLTRDTGSSCPMNRFAEPEEIAQPAIFLASQEASFITGAVLAVDGGKTAGFYVESLERM